MTFLGKCSICGMQIHSKSIFLNSHTMLEQNQVDQLINCPFCGVQKEWFDLLDESLEMIQKSLSGQGKKIIENAMKLEVFNSEFYMAASEYLKDPELADVFRELSLIENFHAKVHMRIGGFKALPKLHKPDYSNREDDAAFIREAELREKHAIYYYSQKVQQIDQPTVKMVFEALSEVEKQHRVILAGKGDLL